MVVAAGVIAIVKLATDFYDINEPDDDPKL